MPVTTVAQCLLDACDRGERARDYVLLRAATKAVERGRKWIVGEDVQAAIREINGKRCG